MKANLLFRFSFLLLLLAPQTRLCAQVFTESNLPIVLIDTDNAQEIPDDPRILADMKIIYKGEGVTNFLSDQDTPAFLNYDGRIDIEIRGSSSQALPKKQYGLTTKMADNVTNNNVSLLGMPPENDWILNGLAFDPSLIRDYLSYNLSRNMGNYAPRTVYCEVVINGDYKGLYILQEKIKADSERVNVTKITSSQNTLPNLSGGYITKADKTTGGDPVAWTMDSYIEETVDFIHELPKPTDVTAQQDTYIHNQFLSLQSTSSTNNSSFVNGYPSVIDVPSFVDFMLSTEISGNVDGYQLSTYFHKDRNGKLRAGPIWDLNLTYGNDLFIYGYDRSHTDVWQFSNGDNEGAKFWRDLFNNTTYKCYLSKRWHELTQPGQPLNPTAINTLIDNTVAYISEAAFREQQRWGTVPNLASEIQLLKNWLAARNTWMTAHIGPYGNCSNVATPPLVISKINYNPGTNANFTNSNDQEFLEIKNTGSQPVNLTGVYFRGTGFVYQFPANQMLAANASVFLASKASVFLGRYGFAASGEFTRNLSNSNQDLVLADGFGNVIDQVHYYDATPWPNADGNGNFLQLTDVALDNNLASSWTATSMDLLDLQNLDGNLKAVQIAPNPASSYISINTSETMSEIRVTDLQGKTLLRQTPQTNHAELNLEAFSAGLYFVKLRFGNEIQTRKILKN